MEEVAELRKQHKHDTMTRLQTINYVAELLTSSSRQSSSQLALLPQINSSYTETKVE